MSSYLVQEADGTSKFTLEDGSGSLLLETVAAPVNTLAPVASGSTPVGSTLSTTDGTWTGSPSFTYQWKRDGSSIGGATTSTYTTVNADGGHAVKCTVTATNSGGSASADSNAITVDAAATTATGWNSGFGPGFSG